MPENDAFTGRGGILGGGSYHGQEVPGMPPGFGVEAGKTTRLLPETPVIGSTMEPMQEVGNALVKVLNERYGQLSDSQVIQKLRERRELKDVVGELRGQLRLSEKGRYLLESLSEKKYIAAALIVPIFTYMAIGTIESVIKSATSPEHNVSLVNSVILGIVQSLESGSINHETTMEQISEAMRQAGAGNWTGFADIAGEVLAAIREVFGVEVAKIGVGAGVFVILRALVTGGREKNLEQYRTGEATLYAKPDQKLFVISAGERSSIMDVLTATNEVRHMVPIVSEETDVKKLLDAHMRGRDTQVRHATYVRASLANPELANKLVVTHHNVVKTPTGDYVLSMGLAHNVNETNPVAVDLDVLNFSGVTQELGRRFGDFGIDAKTLSFYFGSNLDMLDYNQQPTSTRKYAERMDITLVDPHDLVARLIARTIPGGLKKARVLTSNEAYRARMEETLQYVDAQIVSKDEKWDDDTALIVVEPYGPQAIGYLKELVASNPGRSIYVVSNESLVGTGKPPEYANVAYISITDLCAHTVLETKRLLEKGTDPKNLDFRTMDLSNYFDGLPLRKMRK